MKPFLILALLLLSTLAAFTQQRWERTYGGPGGEDGRAVHQTSDGGYIVAGTTTSFGNRSQVYLIKTDAAGDTLWTRNYGDADEDVGESVQVTLDGGYIVAGWTGVYPDFQVLLIKTNALGDTLWTRSYGGAGLESGYSVQQTSGGGYIVAGTTNSFGDSTQIYLIKTNASGDTLWTRTYGGAGSEDGNSVLETSEGGFLIAGYTKSLVDTPQAFLVKTNASGDTLWTHAYGMSSGAASVRETSDSGYIVVGGIGVIYPENQQVYLIRTNSTGDTLWTRKHGPGAGEYGYSVQQTREGGYIVAGSTFFYGDISEVYLLKFKSNGDTLWTRKYGGQGFDGGYSVKQTTDLGYIVTGLTWSFGNNSQVYLIKTDSLGNSTGVEENKVFEVPRGQGFKITPNPFIYFATVPGHEGERFALYDIAGRKVGTYPGSRIGEGLAPGVYFLGPEDRRLKAEGRLIRIVKVR